MLKKIMQQLRDQMVEEQIDAIGDITLQMVEKAVNCANHCYSERLTDAIKAELANPNWT
jgi:hypothetical protein